ncbi:hypothetical protein PMAYCL1PPCAC_18616 [Pristionchus mayeri]|uniref:Apple domain-containing protein n=1 Tax=Pristionchus mayeri TaxID=1317129 RepID=A0AAN5I282_9BILA|nr:hypothetical protein PMAYCL1PPCAC_18616 [Pristionchus mayeri]
MADPLGWIGLLSLLLPLTAAQNFPFQGQRNYLEYGSSSPLHGIPSDAFRVPFPQMYDSYRKENEQSSQPANAIPGMSTSTDSSGRVITSLSMGLRRTKEDELNEMKIVPRERMVHGLRDAKYHSGQEQVIPAAMNTINSVKPRRKPRVEERRRPTSEELYSDIFPSVIESPHSPLHSTHQFTKLRDVMPSSIEQRPTSAGNPMSNNLVRVFAAQVPTAQIDPIDITKSMEVDAVSDKEVEDSLQNDENESTEFVPGPNPPVHTMESKENSEGEGETLPPPTSTTTTTTTIASTTTTVEMTTVQPVSTVVPAHSGSLLPRGKLETIPSALLADIGGEEEGAIVPNSEGIEEAINEEIMKLSTDADKEAEEKKEEMKREEMRRMEEEIRDNQVKINKKRAVKDEVVEKSGVTPLPIMRMVNYRPPPPPVRREVLMEPRCLYDTNLWAMHPKSAVTQATMFARSTGGSCEECLKMCMESQTAPWTCRSVTYDTEWKICDLFAISATANPFHLVEYKGRDYFEYLPASPPTDGDIKKMDEFTLIQKNEEIVTEVKSCEMRLKELQMEVAKLKGLSRAGVHTYSITTPPSLYRQSGVNTEEYTASPISASDMMSVDGGVAEGSASLSMREAAKRTSDAMVMSSKKKELHMEVETPMMYRRRVGRKNRGSRKMKREDDREVENIDADEFNPRSGRITETHVRMVHSDQNPLEAHKEFMREVKISKVNARASAVSTSIGQTLKMGEMLRSDSSAAQLQLESDDIKNAEHTGRTAANMNMPKGSIKMHKIPSSYSINSGSSAEGEGYEKKNLVPPSPIEHELGGKKVISFDEDHPEPLSGDQNKLPPLIDHPTWAVLAASNHDQNTPQGAVVTSNPPSCRGHAHHVFVSFAQTDVVRIGQLKDCPVRTVEECARFCDRESSFECVAFVLDRLGCHLLSVRPDHRNAASFTLHSGATYAEKICMGSGPVHLHGVLGAAREHLLIGTVTTMASTSSLSQCIEECATASVRRGFRCAAAMWYPRYDAQNCHLSQSSRVTRQQGAHLLNSNAIYFEMPPPSLLHRHVMSAIN